MASRALINGLTVLFFVVAISEIMLELFQYIPGIMILKPMIPLLLIVLYWISSDRRHWLYIVAMCFSVVTNLLFIPNQQETLFLALIAFLIHRVFVLSYIIKMLKIKDYIPVVIGTVPFLLIFFYLLGISHVPAESVLLMAVQNLLISLLGGLAVSSFMIHDSQRNSWLLISAMLFVALQAVVFIERFYLQMPVPIMRPLAMGVNAFAFYTFYEFAISVERSDNDRTTL